MMRRILKLYHSLNDWHNIVWKSKNEFNVPFLVKGKYALKGFTTNEYIWYDLKNNNTNQYISEYERIKSRSINGIYKVILDDKMIFEEVFGQHTRVPVNYAWIKNRNIYALHDYKIDRDNLASFLADRRKSVLKYLDRGGGIGTYIIETSSDGLCVNGRLSSNETVKGLFDREGTSILCEYITQSEFAESLYPYTTNTIRMICAKKESEKARVIGAVQRIGRRCSIPVDNFSSGGLACEIDLETGELSSAVAGHGDKEGRMQMCEVHPDTGVHIKGRKIPQWVELKRSIETLMNQFPYLNFVAWDILLTEKTFNSNGYCIIEGNASSSCDLLQIMKPGLRNKELGEIYKSYGIID